MNRMVQLNLISKEQATMVSCEQIARFFTTELGRKLQCSKNVLREFKFSVLDDGSSYAPEMNGEHVLLQGVVDCALVESDGITVVDFKTDHVTENAIASLTDRYYGQVMAYVKALERIYGKPVKYAYLYFFRLNQLVLIHP